MVYLTIFQIFFKQNSRERKIPWKKLKAPNLTKKLSNKIIRETKKQSKGASIKELTTMRDNFLVDLLKLKNKYKF